MKPSKGQIKSKRQKGKEQEQIEQIRAVEHSNYRKYVICVITLSQILVLVIFMQPGKVSQQNCSHFFQK